jgi:hypothetical protein
VLIVNHEGETSWPFGLSVVRPVNLDGEMWTRHASRVFRPFNECDARFGKHVSDAAVLPGFGLILSVKVNVMKPKALRVIRLKNAEAGAFNAPMNAAGLQERPNQGGLSGPKLTAKMNTQAGRARGILGWTKQLQQDLGQCSSNGLGDRLISVVDGQP